MEEFIDPAYKSTAVEKIIYCLGTIFDVRCCGRIQCDMSSHRGKMSSFHEADKKRIGARPLAGTNGRLPLGMSALVIGALSVLSWAALISIAMALRAAF